MDRIISLLILLFMSVNLHAKTPLSVVQCYIEPRKKDTVETGCMSGRCLIKAQPLCLPLNSDDTVTLQYFNRFTSKAIHSADYPCTAPTALEECQTYQGTALHKLRN